jgi:hypothetical protein
VQAVKKIVDVTNSPAIQGPRKPQPKNDNLFHQRLNEAQEKNQTSTANHVAGANRLGEIQPTGFPRIESASTTVANKTDNLLNLLDNYAKDMENPNKSLKDIEPLIVSIQRKASELMDATARISPDLKEIATETAVAANSEYIKFYRGDYN